MTDTQKQNIEKLRLQGMGYRRIAGVLNISENTIKSFCRRNNLEAVAVDTETNADENICKQCGKRLEPSPRSKTFCSDKCRYNYWNANREQRKSARHLICAGCGEVFTVYGNGDRKFCGHPCYINYRFNSVIESKNEKT